MPVVVLGAVLARELNADVQQRYIDTARSSASLLTQVGIQPLLKSQQVADGLTPTEVADIDQKLQGASVSQDVRRIKVWNRNGMIVYSDNHALIGRTFAIDDDLGAALAGHSSASITDGHDEENTGDNLAGPLIQAYVPLVFQGESSPSGAFELYLPYAPVQAAIDSESRQLYVVLGIGLTVFYASMFPVVFVADRWRRRLLNQAEATALSNLAVLERLNALKNEYLTRISHQFRTALVGIQGFSELLRDSEHLDLTDVKAFASDIFATAEGLDRAFSEMVELDRIEAGRSALKLAPLDANALIRDVLQAHLSSTPAHTLLARLDDRAPLVVADREKATQLLDILVSNALRYSPAGSEVVVSSRTRAGYVEIAVKDKGPGMPPDFDDSLFGRQGRRSRSGLGGGQANGSGGLSLQLARQIVEMHGGKIWFESTAGRGTEFHFTLPTEASRRVAGSATARSEAT